MLAMHLLRGLISCLPSCLLAPAFGQLPDAYSKKELPGNATGSSETYAANADVTDPKQLHFRKAADSVPVTIYYNQDWKVTRKESYRYFRKAFFDTRQAHFDGPFEDNDSTGRLMLSGTYVAGEKNGPFTVYHQNGKTDSRGSYQGDVMQGRWEYYYPDGKLKQVLEFGDDDYRIVSFYDSLGNQAVTDGTGTWYDYFGENSQRILLAGKVVNGFREGQWTLKDNLQDLLLQEEFRAGKFKSGVHYFANRDKQYDASLLGKKLFEHPYLKLAGSLTPDKCFYGPDAIDYILGQDPFESIDPGLLATFPGGDREFARFLSQNLRFPRSGLDTGGGKVLVECIVDETGRLSHFKIREGVNTDLNVEAVRVLKLSPPWLPARLADGTPQKARVAVPILFRFETRKRL